MGKKLDKNDRKAADAAWEFFAAKSLFEEQQKSFGDKKDIFYGIMEDYCRDKGLSTVKFDGEGIDNGTLVVKKIEKTSIEWDATKLEKKVDKHVAKRIIKKRYHISDMVGLAKYLKSCGVDPNIFKRFITIDKTVDNDEVDRMGDIGQITVNQISGCYKVKQSKPYFTIQLKDCDG